ncbi:unnamed protein product [Cuscuta epithymum]|uniref:Uncharacterized protein n=1 Tax=Cuscuta epithymum TaxID=186058 RepID=A0AAV0CSP7_9ASTE|nr:unnamed protein product [Cuscuta epithymum]
MAGKDSGEQENGDEAIVSINTQVNEERIQLMQKKLSESPRLLSKSAGRRCCCIFRAPQSFVDVNIRSYQPHICSIGPYHHGKPQLQMIEEHKWRFLALLVERTTEKKGLTLVDYFQAVKAVEAKARECYSEAIPLDSDEFVEILVLDGCFIVELFRKMGRVIPFEEEDPFISMSWIFPCLLRDFIRLENQIPFFVLQLLFDLTKMPDEKSGSLSMMTLTFFNHTLQRPNEILHKLENVEGLHLLDFLRSSYIPPVLEDLGVIKSESPSHVIHCISKLRRAGIKLKPGKEDSFLAIRFRRGAIEMPPITIDDFMIAFLQNCVAYEQCRAGPCGNHVTTYATLLDCLINTYKDVEYLCDSNIFENYFGTEGEVATFVNRLGKDVMFDIDTCYLSQLFDEVNQYYRNSWHVQWASFKYTYFNSPWSFISALAAFVLLVLAIVQALYAILAYVKPPGS